MSKKFIFGGSYTSFVYDADALLYFAANSAITLDADKLAIDTFYKGLKSDGVYTKMKAMYFPKWSSAANNKWNLVNPVDSDAAHRLTFTGGWTHASTGITGNGVNAYANTYFVPSAHHTLSSAHISIYSRTNIDGLYCDIGVSEGAADTNIFAKFGSAFYPRVQNTNSGISNTGTSQRLFISNRVTNTQIRAMQDGVLKLIANNTLSNPTVEIYISALRRAGNTTTFFSPREYPFATIGDGLTDQNMTDLTTRVNTLMTYFGINV